MDGSIKELKHASSHLQRNNKKCVVVIPNRTSKNKRLPICYFLHGWGGNASSFISNEAIVKSLLRMPQISVFPESFRNWFINDSCGNNYESYFIEELVPLVERECSELVDTSKRIIAGFSMGGFSAYMLSIRYPGKFRALCTYAGAFEAPLRTGDPYKHVRNDPNLLMPTIEQHERVWGPEGSQTRQRYDPYGPYCKNLKKLSHIMVYVGNDDYERMVAMNRRFHEHLKNMYVNHDYIESEGAHDMAFVASCLEPSIAAIHKSIA